MSGGGFVKVVPALWHGTLYGQADAQLVFLFLLAHASSSGTVDVTLPFIAGATGIPLERVRAALEFLESEDPESRSPDEGGRRLVRLEPHRSWGWRLVNYGRYRWTRDPDARREQTREAMRRSRGGEGYLEGFGGLGPLDGTATTYGQCEPRKEHVSHGEPKQKQKQKQKQNPSSLRSEGGGVVPDLNLGEPKPADGSEPGIAGNGAGFAQEALGGVPPTSDSSSTSGRVPRASLAVPDLPTTEGGRWQPDPALLERFREAYPAVDLPREFRRIAAWLEANPRNRKTARGMSAFVNRWLAREQDRGGTGGGARGGIRSGADARYLEANGGNNANG